MEILFNKGLSANSYPIKAVYSESDHPHTYPAQAMFVVPKRNFKRAHDRNKLKRRMREAYRTNKSVFYETLSNSNKKLSLAFIFISKKEETFALIENATKKLLNKVVG